jgi:TRAP-type C4-dicarboxylate transport system substrate-binding protein
MQEPPTDAVQTGVVDGVIGSGAEGYYASFRDVTKTYIPANTHFEVWYMIISNESLAELSDEGQAALKEQAAAFEATRWEVAEADQGKNEQRLVDDLGATVAKLSADDLAGMAAKVRADVWPAVLEDVGVEWGQAILDEVAAAGN